MPESRGGICLSTSVVTSRRYASLSPGFPGTIAAPCGRAATASSRVCKLRLPLICALTGPWHWKQVSDRIGRTSRLQLMSSDAAAVAVPVMPSEQPHVTAIHCIDRFKLFERATCILKTHTFQIAPLPVWLSYRTDTIYHLLVTCGHLRPMDEARLIIRPVAASLMRCSSVRMRFSTTRGIGPRFQMNRREKVQLVSCRPDCSR